MRCKYCGGEINLSVGKCVRCGRSVDETSNIRIVHDLEALADSYGIKTDALPEQPAAARESDAAWHELAREKNAGAVPQNLPDVKAAKKPTIGLSTYMELLGEQENEQPVEPPVSEQTEAAKDEQPQEPEQPVAPGDTLLGKARRLASKAAHRLDGLTKPYTERVRGWYHTKVPELSRAESRPMWERLAVVGGALVVLVIIIMIIASVVSAIPNSVVGEWRVSEPGAEQLFTVSFERGGAMKAFVYEGDTAHLYKSGEYDTSRKNGRNMLTITLDDGSISHLYYEVNGESGTFTNVDTGREKTYLRLD